MSVFALCKQSEERATSTFLSGYGPLVQVLQDALRSQVFVRDLHKFITSYGLTERVLDQQLIVLDEAQRAWDSGYMCWGDDMIWSGNEWALKPKARCYPIEDPKELLRNAYRVLLTRGRDGLVIWVPPDPTLAETADVRTLAGAARDFEHL